jgi:hypothetical protein
MPATQSNPTSPRSSRVLGRTDTPLTLLVRGGEHNGRTIRITSSKCTVGSARGCTFRLQAAGVRPVHCWILRGARTTLLQAWSADVQLNGAAVREAALRPGDRLQIGPIEFEVLTGSPPEQFDCPAGPLAPSHLSLPQLPTTGEPRRRLEDRLSAAEEALQRREAEVEVLHRSAQAQVDQHRDAFHLLRNECDQQQTQLAWEQSQWQSERAAFDAQLAQATTALEQQSRQAAEARKLAFDEAKQLADSLLESNHELRQLRETVQTQREEFQSRRLDLQSALAAVQAQADERQQQLATQRDDAARQSAGLIELVGQLRSELAAVSQQHTSALAERDLHHQTEWLGIEQRLESGAAELARVRQELSQSHAQRDELETRVQTLTAQLRNREADHAAQCGEVAALQAQFAAEKGTLAELAAEWEGRCNLSGHTVDELQSKSAEEICRLRNEIIAMAEERDTLHDRIANLDEQLSAHAAQHAAPSEQVGATQTPFAYEQDSLAQQIANWEVRYEAREQELAEVREELREARATVAAERDSFQEQTAQWQTRVNEMEVLADRQSDLHIAELQTVRAATSAAEAERNRLQAERATLLEEQAVLQGKCANLARQIARLESELAAERESSSSDTADQGSMTMLIPRQTAELREDLTQLKTVQQQLAAAQADAQEKQLQLDALQQSLAAAEKAVEASAAEGNSAEAWNEQRTKLASDLADRAAQVERLTAQCEQLQEQLAALQREAVQLREQLATRSDDLQGERTELAALRQSLTAEQERLAAWQQIASDENATFAKQQTAAQHDCEAWESLLKDKEESLERRALVLAEQSNELSLREADLNQQLAEVDAQLARLQATQGEPCQTAPDSCVASEPASEPANESVSESFADKREQPETKDSGDVDSILARLGEAGLLRSEPGAESFTEGLKEQTEGIEPAEAPLAENPDDEIRSTLTLPKQSGDGAAEDDDSIESYMSQLLRRVRGEESFVHTTSVLSSISRPSEPPKSTVEPVAPPPPPVVDSKPVTPSEYLPRSQAPEQTVDVAAMRELANSAARMAISTHANKHTVKRAAGKLIIGAIASVVASVALGFWALRSGSWIAVCGALASFAGLGYFALKMGISSCNFLRLARPSEQQKPKANQE